MSPSQLTLRVAGAQINSAGTIEASRRKALGYIRRASGRGANFILFPEMYLTDYTTQFDESEAEESLDRIREGAKRHGIHVLMGTGGKHLGVTTNQVRIYTKTGKLAGIHEKMLNQAEEGYEPGRRLKVFNLDGLCFAVLICNDFWATPRSTRGTIPLLPQAAQDLGAHVIFHAIACNTGAPPAGVAILKSWHVANHRTWAYRIGITIVAANPPGQTGSHVNCGIIGPDGQYIARLPNKGQRLFVGDVTVPRSRKGKTVRSGS